MWRIPLFQKRRIFLFLVSEVDLTGLTADEDDTLNDEMHRLAECIENIR
jgi:hypothetical protein